nr:uncharacterized protein LOC111508316 isoform X1 [Leptinotarsa decemlineata]
MDNRNNMLQLCRLCLVKDDVNIPIFEEHGDIRQIFLKISSCLPVKVSREDKLPKKICDGCSFKLDTLYEFCNTSANAEKQLLTWLGEAGMNSQMVDGTITAVTQQIKPTDTFVKEETIEPPDIHNEDDDDKDYMFQQKFEESASAGPSATVTSNEEEEPPPKRARRTAAVKAAIALDHDSDDDDDDSGEPMTKVEDESEESEGEDQEPSFADAPSTSADDQPGPSGVGKDGVEAPMKNRGFSKKILDKNWTLRECKVILTDVKYDKSVTCYEGQYSINDERKKFHTCYICMAKFLSLSDLDIHKNLHSYSDAEDDLFEEDFIVNSEKSANKASWNATSPEEKVKNLDDSSKDSNIVFSSLKPKVTLQNNEDKNSTTQTDKVKPPFKCVVCDVFFETSDEAKKHVPKASKEKCKFSCHLCNRKFNTLYAFVVHVMQHKTNVVKNQLTSRSTYVCTICEKHFNDCFQLKRHEITTHKKKTISQLTPQQTSSEVLANTIASPKNPETTIESNEQIETEFTCELCYDIFPTKEELDSHTDFHRQIERISEPVIPDDTEATVEIIEDFRDKHEIVTTIQKAKTNSYAPKTNTVELTYDKFSLAPNPPLSTLPKQNLTAKIKEMIAPKSSKTDVKQKSSKTIFLPNIQPPNKAKPGPKAKPLPKAKPGPKPKLGSKLKPKPQLKLQRTSPTSFSVSYTEPQIPSTSQSMSSGLPPLLPKPFLQTKSKAEDQDAKDSGNEKNVSSPHTTESSRIELETTQVQNQSLFNSTPELLMSGVSNPGLSYILNPTPSVPVFNTSQFGSSTAVSLSNDISSITAPTTQYAYVVIPNSMSPSSRSISTSVNSIIPAVKEALRNQFSSKPPDPNSVQPIVQSSDELTGGITMPVIYNVMSLNESTKVGTIAESGAKSATSLPQVDTGLSSVVADNTVSSKMSSVRSSIMAPTTPGEIICLDSESDTEDTTNKPVESTAQNDSDEGGDLVIDDSANQSGAESPETKKDSQAQIGADDNSKDADGNDTKRGNGKGGKPVKEKRWTFPAKCDTCNAKFQRFRSMRLHNERKVCCRNCAFKCCRTMELKNHYLTEHKIFYCWRCNFLTQIQEEFMEHRKNHTCLKCGGVYVEMKNHICKKVMKQNREKRSDSPITLSE